MADDKREETPLSGLQPWRDCVDRLLGEGFEGEPSSEDIGNYVAGDVVAQARGDITEYLRQNPKVGIAAEVGLEEAERLEAGLTLEREQGSDAFPALALIRRHGPYHGVLRLGTAEEQNREQIFAAEPGLYRLRLQREGPLVRLGFVAEGPVALLPPRLEADTLPAPTTGTPPTYLLGSLLELVGKQLTLVLRYQESEHELSFVLVDR